MAVWGPGAFQCDEALQAVREGTLTEPSRVRALMHSVALHPDVATLERRTALAVRAACEVVAAGRMAPLTPRTDDDGLPGAVLDALTWDLSRGGTPYTDADARLALEASGRVLQLLEHGLMGGGDLQVSAAAAVTDLQERLVGTLPGRA